MSLRLIILGLRRSGTTIFWQTFRQDPGLLCYDEPFNPHLRVLPDGPGIKSPEEFVRLIRSVGREFWERFAPIHFADELNETLDDRQIEYLRYLTGGSDDVVIDVTRCHFKIEALHELAPEATLVHLHRSPAGHASSHLLPNAVGLRGKLKRTLGHLGFWTRTSGYDGWSFESIIGTSPGSSFGRHLAAAGLDPAEVYALPAVGRLLAYWRVAYDRVEHDGRRLFGERFVSQSFDDFCADPRRAVERIYRTMGRALPDLDYSRIRPARGPYQAGSSRWRHYHDLLSLPRV